MYGPFLQESVIQNFLILFSDNIRYVPNRVFAPPCTLVVFSFNLSQHINCPPLSFILSLTFSLFRLRHFSIHLIRATPSHFKIRNNNLIVEIFGLKVEAFLPVLEAAPLLQGGNSTAT